MHVHEKLKRMPNIENMERKGSRDQRLDIRNSRFDFGMTRDPSSILRSSRSEPYEIYTLSHYHHRREPSILRFRHSRNIYFLRKEQPSVNRALPPVGWHLFPLAFVVDVLHARHLQDL